MFDNLSFTLPDIALVIGAILALLQLLEFLVTRNVWFWRFLKRWWRWLMRIMRRDKYRGRKILLNLSGHPLQESPQRAEAVRKTLGWPTEDLDIMDVKVPTIPTDSRFAEKACTLLTGVNITESEWQTLPMAVIPPGFGPLCAVLLADLHGRMGYFPQMAYFAREDDVWVLRPEVIGLQSIRDEGRSKRHPATPPPIAGQPTRTLPEPKGTSHQA